MALKRAGFFRELRHGDGNGPSIVACRAPDPAPDRERIAGYLRGGTILAATGTRVADWFEPGQEPSVALALLTDGTWVWPSDLAHYVEKHGVRVPDEFMEHMSGRGWEATAVAPDTLLRLEAELFGES